MINTVAQDDTRVYSNTTSAREFVILADVNKKSSDCIDQYTNWLLSRLETIDSRVLETMNGPRAADGILYLVYNMKTTSMKTIKMILQML